MRLSHVKYRHSPEYDDMNPRWIVCAYIGEGFLDFRLGPHRWRLHRAVGVTAHTERDQP